MGLRRVRNGRGHLGWGFTDHSCHCEVQGERYARRQLVGCPLQVFKGREDFIHTTNVQNASYSLKVNEFAALSINELVSRYTGYKPNNVCSTMYGVA